MFQFILLGPRAACRDAQESGAVRSGLEDKVALRGNTSVHTVFRDTDMKEGKNSG